MEEGAEECRKVAEGSNQEWRGQAHWRGCWRDDRTNGQLKKEKERRSCSWPVRMRRNGLHHLICRCIGLRDGGTMEVGKAT